MCEKHAARERKLRVVSRNTDGYSVLEAARDMWEGLADDFPRLRSRIFSALSSQGRSCVVLVPSCFLPEIEKAALAYA